MRVVIVYLMKLDSSIDDGIRTGSDALSPAIYIKHDSN